ncbi:MAG: hypothetical protein WAN92_04030 [Herbaspirillum sp.]
MARFVELPFAAGRISDFDNQVSKCCIVAFSCSAAGIFIDRMQGFRQNSPFLPISAALPDWPVRPTQRRDLHCATDSKIEKTG